MTSANMQQRYKNLLTEAVTTKARLNNKSIKISTFRLLSFVLAVIGAFVYANSQNTIWIIASAVLILCLIILAVTHSRLIEQLKHTENRITILQNELDCIGFNPKTYGNGEQHKRLLPFADDLDLFGNKSLFHLINRCSTTGGEKILAKSLIEGKPSIENVKEMQEAVKEMAAQTDLRIESLTTLRGIKDIEHTKSHDIKDDKFLRISQLAYPPILATSIAAFVVTGSFAAIIICLAAAWAIAYHYNQIAEQCAKETESLHAQLSVFGKIAENLNSISFKSPLINKMKLVQRQSAYETKRLASINKGFERRENILWLSISNLLFLNDLHLIRRYSNWKSNNDKNIGVWIDSLSELEALLSCACFAANNQEYAYPEFTEELCLEGKNLRHPLLNKDIAIGNDVSLCKSPRFMLITGSNMSGKSTWLRTLGTNTIMAQAGMPVCADSMTISMMKVLSSLRQSDSLSESTSLFMNELNELNHILKTIDNGTICLILLDEILRGTNSDDKYTGSKAFANKLTQYNSITVMATHDLKLGELEKTKPDTFTNYCFESRVENDKLLFDYRIRRGIATNRNATWIMKNMGII